MAQGDYGTPSNRVDITSERWKYTPHTSDPPSTEKGDEWLRIDLDSGDKIATLRFQYNSSGDVWNFPIFPTSETAPSQIKKEWRFDTPNGEGFVPLYEQGGSYRQRAFDINGTRHGVHNSLAIIPSGAIHRWTLEEDSDPFMDSIGNADGTNFGTTQVTNGWVGDAARQGNGSDQYVETTTLGSFGSSTFPSGFSLTLTVQGSSFSNSDTLLGTFNDGSGMIFQLGMGIESSDTGKVAFRMRDTLGNILVVTHNTAIDDGNKHRVGLTCNDPTTASSYTWYIDGFEDGVDTVLDDGVADSFADFQYPLNLFAVNDRGTANNHTNAIEDDVVLFDSELTAGESYDDYNRQPWDASYFALNGIGAPVYSTNQPPAVYNSGADTTFVVYQGPDSDPYAMAYDHSAGEWADATQIGTNPLTDDNHGVPAVTQDDSGVLHCFWGSHANPMQYARTTSANDISSWTSQVGLGSSTTYPKPVHVGGTLYLFYRHGATTDQYPEEYITSTDGGSTWSSPTTVINFSDRTIYVGDVWQDGADIHIVWDNAPTPGLERYEVYYAQFNPSDNTLYAADGTNLGSSIDQTEADNNALVYDSGSDYVIVPRVRIDGSGNPHIIWNRNTGADENGEWTYEYSYWTGSSWTAPQAITTTQGVTEGAAFALNSASDITAQLAVPDNSDGLVNIEEWQYDGSLWSQSDTILQGSEYGKDLASPSTPMPYSDELDVLFTEQTGDYTTDLKVFSHGSGGFLGR